MEGIGGTEAVIATALSQISQDDWTSLALSTATSTRWHEEIWWHNKYYRVNGANDGRAVQTPKKGKPEIPYYRELFYPSPHSRFSLGAEAGVAYFSNNSIVNCCETIEQFSENPKLSLEDLLQYGGGNPTPGWHGYLLNFHLSASALVLDLSSNRSLFFRLLGPDIAENVWYIVTNRDSSARQCTQLIAKAAINAGFDGIIYTSVRAPIDAVMPDSNLVMYNKAKIESGPPQIMEK